MSKSNLYISPLAQTRELRLLEGLCVAAGADQISFIPDTTGTAGNCHVINPLRGQMDCADPLEFECAKSHNQMNFKIRESEKGQKWFSDKLCLPGMRGTLYIMNHSKLSSENNAVRRFENINLQIYALLKDSLTEAYATGLNNATTDNITSGMLSFANRSMGVVREWHAETQDHSDNVAILFNTFLKHAATHENNAFHNEFKKASVSDLASWNIMAILHDIGKTLIPFDVLDFKGIYSHEQRARMEQHAAAGYYIMGAFGSKRADLAGLHHQFYKGVGPERYAEMKKSDPKLRPAYPMSEFIEDQFLPTPVRILQVLDCFEGVIHRRSYKNVDGNTSGRPARDVADALTILVREANGGVLDPVVVHTFISQKTISACAKLLHNNIASDKQPKPVKHPPSSATGLFANLPKSFQTECMEKLRVYSHVLLTGEIPKHDARADYAAKLQDLAHVGQEFGAKIRAANAEKVPPGPKIHDPLHYGTGRSQAPDVGISH
ncbi:MAG: hypothetical protein U1E36_09045 [Rickettsiales bacterium]